MLYMTSFPATEKKNHEKEHAAGKLLLSYAVKEEYGWQTLPEINRHPYGKPYFPKYAQIYFNISHSGNRVVCALGKLELGVDIEQIRGVKESLCKRVLSERELEWMEACENREEAFTRLWTLKESFVKTTGEGLRTELRSVEFTIQKQGEISGISCNQNGFSFYQEKIGDAYLSLCVKADRVPEELKKMHIVFL